MNALIYPLLKDSDAEYGLCFCCDKHDLTFDVGGNVPELRCCRTCIRRWGHKLLAEAADRILHAAIKAVPKKPIKCGHCEDEIAPDEDGKYPSLMCERCNAEAKARFKLGVGA